MNKHEQIKYIDNLKTAITFLVVAHHAGQAYGNTGEVWLVTDFPKLDFLSSFFFLNAAYMMGLFFFLSGYFMYFSIIRKNTELFLKDRLKRLAVPLLFFMLLIFVPLNYLMSDTKGNYFLFMYDNYVNNPPLAVGHLWFVASLLVYTFIFLAIKKQILEGRKWNWQPWFPLFYLAILTLVNYFVWLKYPIDYWVTWLIPVEVVHLPQYFSLFFLGVLANKNKWLEQISMRLALTYFSIAIMLFCFRGMITTYLGIRITEPLTENALCIGMIMGILIIFRKTMNITNPVLNFFAKCSYGIYLFHLLIVIGFQIALKPFEIDTFTKFILVTVLGIITSAGLTFLFRKHQVLARILQNKKNCPN